MSGFFAGVLAFSFTTVYVSAEQAREEVSDTKVNTQQSSEDNAKISTVIGKHITVAEKDGIAFYGINDSDTLNMELTKLNAPFDVLYVSKSLRIINDKLVYENGNGFATSAIEAIKNGSVVKDIIYAPNKRVPRNTCSWTFFGVGTYHALTYSVAAAALGVTGVGAVLIPAAIGAAYGAAGAAAC